MQKDEASRKLQENFWSESWVKHIESYLAATPRCGIWLYSYFDLDNLTVLECAGGSCRDSRYLYENEINAHGTDYDEKTLNYLSSRFVESNFKVSKEDAFKFNMLDKSYDVSFHNGFWIYFTNDDINKLIVEQARVTRKYIVALVHNIENKKLVLNFRKLAIDDDLYKIRFFHRNELKGIINNSGISYKSIRIEKFGGILDACFLVSKKYPILDGLIKFLVPKLYIFQPWGKVERIALVVELN